MGSPSHAYHFAHWHLPHMLLNSIAARRWLPLFEAAAQPGAERKLIHTLWDSAADELEPAARRPGDDIVTSLHDGPQGEAIFIVQLPAPREPAEAYFVAPVADRASGAWLRYYTLEKGIHPATQRETTFLGEWFGDGSRLNHGEGPMPERDELRALAGAIQDQFLTAILQRLSDPRDGRVRGHTLLGAARQAVALGALETASHDYRQAISALSDVWGYRELTDALFELSQLNPADATGLTVQAFWLSLHRDVDLERPVELAEALSRRLGATPEAARIARVAEWNVEISGAPPAHRAELASRCQRLVIEIGGAFAATPAAFSGWIRGLGFHDPNVFVPAFKHDVDTLVPPDAWTYDRSRVRGGHPIARIRFECET